jgi:hypothetical protein
MEDAVKSLSGTLALTSSQIRTSGTRHSWQIGHLFFQTLKKSGWKLHETGHLFRCLEQRPEVVANRTLVVSLQRSL